MHKLDIEFRGVYQSCPKSVLHRFVRSIDAQLTKYVLAMGVDGMNARKAVGGNLFGCFPLGDSLEYLKFGGSQRSCSSRFLGLLAKQ